MNSHELAKMFNKQILTTFVILSHRNPESHALSILQNQYCNMITIDSNDMTMIC